MGLNRTVRWGAALLMAGGVAVTAAEAKSTRKASITISVADPSIQGDGTMSPTARRAMLHGALPMSPQIAILKAAKDRASAARRGLSEAEMRGPLAPAIVGGHNFRGQRADTLNTQLSPPDTTGAIGTTRYIQMVNAAVRIIDRNTHAAIASGSLNKLAELNSTVFSFDPQIIWDPTTNRFYYAMASIFSATDNRIAFGFSKTASPANLVADWCHYTIDDYGTFFPDYPKLGDSRYFIIIGVNVFDPNFYDGSDIIAISKPPAGTTCPAVSSFKKGIEIQLKDTGGAFVFTPVPSNQIDNNGTGYVATVDGHLPPVDKLWFFNVTKNATRGLPVFGAGRAATVPFYDLPTNVPQANGRLIDSSDTRITQAVQAINPSRGTRSIIHSFWTQHTVDDPSGRSVVRWYEINPAPGTPVVLRTGKIVANNAWAFNGAISPDRKVNGTAKAFGDSSVIQYNAASTTLDPRILARSSLHGGAVSGPRLIKRGVDQYQDFTCPSAGNVCRWGDYAAATPDPAPGTTGAGVVWGTNQFSGVVAPPITNGNWRTRIFAVKP